MIRTIKTTFICIVFCLSFSSTFSSSFPSNFRIVVSFSLIKNWVDILTHGVSPDMAIITIASLVPISCDPHMYQPTPMDAKAIEEAHLILTIGLSFEGWMNYLISSSGTKGTIFEITNGIDARISPIPDPHVWHDVEKVRQIINNLAKILCDKLPNAANLITKNADVYDKKLKN